jgi:hypothetical protein
LLPAPLSLFLETWRAFQGPRGTKTESPTLPNRNDVPKKMGFKEEPLYLQTSQI